MKLEFANSDCEVLSVTLCQHNTTICLTTIIIITNTQLKFFFTIYISVVETSSTDLSLYTIIKTTLF